MRKEAKQRIFINRNLSFLKYFCVYFLFNIPCFVLIYQSSGHVMNIVSITVLKDKSISRSGVGCSYRDADALSHRERVLFVFIIDDL